MAGDMRGLPSGVPSGVPIGVPRLLQGKSMYTASSNKEAESSEALDDLGSFFLFLRVGGLSIDHPP